MNKNRYGDEWCWEKQENNIYKFIMTGDSLEYCRFGGVPGGRTGASIIDNQNLGMFDPSGGPYISIAPAYNKGAYQVISRSNVKDIGR